MLDQSIKEQLTNVFSALENPIQLVVKNSDHAKQKDLLELLEGVAETSSKISLEQIDESSKNPHLAIHLNGQATGVTYTGIPSGHEFSSLVLSILNADLKGKLPDQGIQNRIKNLKGDIKLATIVSLSCENCPEVVQTLNLMAILNPSITHEMIDGEFTPELIEELKVQGVPSTIHDKSLISSGKSSLIEILEKLEEKFSSSDDHIDQDLGSFDVAIIGGGPAGASSAIYTARKGLKVALIADKIGGQLQETKGIENLISIPYTEGPKLSAHLLEHMSQYDIQIYEHRKVKQVEKGKFKTIHLTSGESLTTKSVIITTGAKWRELNIPGEKEYLGRGVAFCPHCDGPFYKGKNISVIGGGNSGVEAAIDLAGIVNHVTVIEFAPELKADEVLVNKLKSLPNVNVITNAKTEKVIGNGEKVTGLEYTNRESDSLETLDLDGVFVQIGLVPNSAFVKDVVETSKFGEILVDEKNRTSAAGIYAAGDVTNNPYKQIIIAMGEGAKAGLTVFEDLMLA